MGTGAGDFLESEVNKTRGEKKEARMWITLVPSLT